MGKKAIIRTLATIRLHSRLLFETPSSPSNGPPMSSKQSQQLRQLSRMLRIDALLQSTFTEKSKKISEDRGEVVYMLAINTLRVRTVSSFQVWTVQ